MNNEVDYKYWYNYLGFFYFVIILYYKYVKVCFCDKNMEGKMFGFIGKMLFLLWYCVVIVGVLCLVMVYRLKCWWCCR